MDLPVVDLAPFLGAAAAAGAAEEDEEVRALCATVSASLRDTGALLVKDPCCSAADNDRFIDVVERYFARSDEDKRLQERPQLHYQEPTILDHHQTRNAYIMADIMGAKVITEDELNSSSLTSAVEKSTWGKFRRWRRETSVEARKGRPLALSPDESRVEGLLQLRCARPDESRLQ